MLRLSSRGQSPRQMGAVIAAGGAAMGGEARQGAAAVAAVVAAAVAVAGNTGCAVLVVIGTISD